MNVGAYFLPVQFDIYIESVRRADRAGFTHAWVCDSQMIWQDPYVYMARGLAETEQLVFGTAVTNPVTRHFSVTASGHATLASMHPGRVGLGLGRGDSAIRTLGLRPARIAEMRTLLPNIRTLLAGESLNLDGTDVRIPWAGAAVPLMLAGTGPRTMALAGALADIVTLELGVNPASIAWALEHVARGAADAGREPGQIEVVVLCAMWLGDELAGALERCRWAPASAANHISEVMHNNPEHGMPASLTGLAELRRSLVPASAGLPSVDGTYDYYGGHCSSDAEHARWIPDAMIDDFVLAGTVERILPRLAELERLGVSQIAVAFLNGEFEQIERIGSELIPRLQAPASAV